MRKIVLVSLCVGLLAVCGAVAQEGQGSPQISAEEMAAWEKSMTPGEHHKHLAVLAGNWNAKISMWMAPGAQPTTSSGTAVFEQVMGGRYVIQKYTGDFMGMAFEGMGIVGYDNVLGHYVSTWMDNMGTGIMMETGSCDGTGKVFRSEGEASDPMTGGTTKLRSVHRIESADRHVLEMFGAGPDGKEFRMMEVVYTRK